MLQQITKRDGQALVWIGENYGVRMDTVTVLLSRLTGDGPLLRQSASRIVGRWCEMNLVTKFRALNRTWITPTQKGLLMSGLPYKPWSCAITQLQHVHQMALSRLAYEAAGGDPDAWLSERFLRAERGTQRWHLPDASIELDNISSMGLRDRGWLHPSFPAERGRLAVEVELTIKNRKQMEEILNRPRHPETCGVIYLTRPELTDRLEKLIAELSVKSMCRLPTHIQPLPIIDGIDPAVIW